jgi:hypothetical protein
MEEESVYEMAMHYYPIYWDIHMVKELVHLDILTQQQYTEITNQSYEPDTEEP